MNKNAIIQNIYWYKPNEIMKTNTNTKTLFNYIITLLCMLGTLYAISIVNTVLAVATIAFSMGYTINNALQLIGKK